MTAKLEEFFSGSLSLTSEMEIKSALVSLPAHRGLVLFADIENRPIQLLTCADMRRTATARLLLLPGQPAWKTDISKICKTVFWLDRPCELACQLSYISLSRIFFSEQFEQLIQLPTISFVTLDCQGRLPYFQSSEKLSFRKGLHTVGPFIARRYASAYAQALNEAFGLCRNPAFLLNKKYESCPYLQMKTCPGPCRNSQIPPEYNSALQLALDAASGQINIALKKKQNQMQQLSANMQFEQAGEVRNQIDYLKTLKNPEYRFIHAAKDFLFLHIDRQKKTKNPLFCAYLINCAQCMELESFKLDEYDAFYHKLTGIIPNLSAIESYSKELLAQTCHFIYKNRKPGLWIDCSGKKIPGQTELNSLINQWITQKSHPDSNIISE